MSFFLLFGCGFSSYALSFVVCLSRCIISSIEIFVFLNDHLLSLQNKLA